MFFLGAEQRAEEVGSELGVAGGWVAEGWEDVDVGRGGEVEVPVACRDDLAGGWVKGFDATGGWVCGHVVYLVAYPYHCEFDVGITWRRWRIVAGVARRRMGVAKHDV